MMQDVIIDIRGTQENGGEENVIELNTEGRFGAKDGGYFLSYEEGEISGLGDVKTVLTVHPDHSIVLQRTGSFQSRLAIEMGKRNTSIYRTPHGNTMIGIYCESVENDLTPDGGQIFMRYTVDSDLKLISRNTVRISVRKI